MSPENGKVDVTRCYRESRQGSEVFSVDSVTCTDSRPEKSAFRSGKCIAEMSADSGDLQIYVPPVSDTLRTMVSLD